MSIPDRDILRDDIYQAIEGMGGEEALEMLADLAGKAPSYYAAHLSMEHTVPSPSGVTNCRLQQWFKGQGIERDTVPPAAWDKRAAAGVLTESWWLTVLKMAGLDIRLPDKAIPCGSVMRAHPDAYIGDDGLLELKDKTGWAYKRILESLNLAYEEPREYMQAQLYMHAANRDWCLYLASPADPALLQSLMRQWKKYGKQYELPLFHMEVIERREVDILAGLARGEMIAKDQESADPPPREFNGIEFDRKGNKAWPCGYCQWGDTCRSMYNGNED